MLLEPGFLSRLEQLALLSRRLYAGQQKGERRSTRRGASVEFADYRNYVPGDDLRRVDWNTFARLERLFLKLFVAEEELTVHLLLDTSRSMAFGDPTKLHYAQQVAAALGYIALTGFDRVTVTALGGSPPGAAGTPRTLPALRGRNQALRLFQFLDDLAPPEGLGNQGNTAPPQGLGGQGNTVPSRGWGGQDDSVPPQSWGGQGEPPTNLGRALHDYARTTRSTGLVIFLSDLLDAHCHAGLRALAARRFDVTLIHLLDRTEVNPQLVGDLRLVDCETGETREVSINQYLLGRYRRALAEYCGELTALCTRYGMNYIRTTTDVPFDELVLRTLRARGVLR